MSDVKLDEVGYWSEIKLDIIKKYVSAYSKIVSNQSFIKGHYYIDGFAGAGTHISKTTGEFIPGSPRNALNIEPPFTGYHFIDLNSGKVDLLREMSKENPNVKVYEGDCNKILLDEILPSVKYEDYKRAICVLDPYGIHLNWEVMYTAGQMKSIEIFLNFSTMDMNMNVLRRNPEKVDQRQIERMNAFWGDESWREAAYSSTPGLFADIEEKNNNDAVAQAFKKRLKTVAGFEFVPDPVPMRNTSGSTIFYLFFASPNRTGARIVEDVFNKYRNMGLV